MTIHAMFLSLVAEGRYEKAADIWEHDLRAEWLKRPIYAYARPYNEFVDTRERLGDEAAALDVADAIATAAG